MGVNLAKELVFLYMYPVYASFILSSHPVTGNYSWLSVDEQIISPCMSYLTKAAGSKGSRSLSLVFLSSFMEGPVNSSSIPVPIIATAVSINLTVMPATPDSVISACQQYGNKHSTCVPTRHT